MPAVLPLAFAVSPPQHTQAIPGSLSRKGKIVQIAGFAIGIALLAWAVSLAMRGENQAALARLKVLPLSTLAWLVLLTLTSLVLNGLMFWLTARPLWRSQHQPALMKPLPIAETIAINCIATFLSLLPFKLGLLVRSFVHVRRHGVPVSSLLAWFAMFAAMTASVALLAGGIALLRQRVDLTWLALVAVGLAVMALTVKALAPHASALARKLAQLLPFASPLTALATPAAVIAGSPTAFAAHAALRLLDFVTFAARFSLLATALGIALSREQAMLLGSTFLLLNASAPAGSLGFADVGVAGAGVAVGLLKEQVVLLSLVTTALQSVVAGIIAIVVWPMVRPRAASLSSAISEVSLPPTK